MTVIRPTMIFAGVLLLLLLAGQADVEAAKVTVDLGDSPGVTMVGAFNRWDMDGNARKPVNKDAKIETPEVDATAVNTGGGKWVFKNLPKGKYDLVIMAGKRVRIEGWHYPPVMEFDPFLPPDATCDNDAREFISEHIKKSRHYENKVVPLNMGGDKKVIRTLVMLIRDLPTSYIKGAGTMRFEVWQYTWNYGGWVKERRTRVLHRVLLQVSELRQWTWLWEPRLGGIEVKDSPLTVNYKLPKAAEAAKLKGLRPY